MKYLKKTIKIRLIFGQKLAKYLLKDLLHYILIGYTKKNFTKDLKD